MAGYKPKSTFILLGQEAATVDFVLDPEITPTGSSLRSGCDCSWDRKSRLKLVEFLSVPQVELSFVAILILIFLCFLLKRRAILKYLKHRRLVEPKRSSVV